MMWRQALAEIEPALEALRQHHATIDAAVAEASRTTAERGAPVQCAAGCGGCCRFLVSVGSIEAIAIASHLRKTGQDSPGLRMKLEAGAKLMARKSHGEYWRLGRYCALLGSDQSCTVYPVRPGLCRLHNSISPREKCDDLTSMSVTYEGAKDEHRSFCESVAESCLPGWPGMDTLPALVLRALRANLIL